MYCGEIKFCFIIGFGMVGFDFLFVEIVLGNVEII